MGIYEAGKDVGICPGDLRGAGRISTNSTLGEKTGATIDPDQVEPRASCQPPLVNAESALA